MKFKQVIELKTESISDQAQELYDDWPLLNFRRHLVKLKCYFNSLCLLLVKNTYFDNLSLLVILINSCMILISDPRDENSIVGKTESIFLYIYTTELLLKVFSYGLILNKGSYLRDGWSIIDFFVVAIGWISLIIENTSISSGAAPSGLSALRAFRILRPLKSIKSVKGLKDIIVTLVESISSLVDILIVLFFFLLIFAVAGLQMWSGLFKMTCFNLDMGYFLYKNNYSTLCSTDNDCLYLGSQWICAKGLSNPNNEVTNFDTTYFGLMTVYIVITLEGWTEVYSYVSRTFKDTTGINQIIIDFYFFILVFVGGFYLLNLNLAVIKTSFSKIEEENKTKKKNVNYGLGKLVIMKLEDQKGRKKKIDDHLKEIEETNQYYTKLKEYAVPINLGVLNDICVNKTLSPKEKQRLKKSLENELDNIDKEFKQSLNKIMKERKLKKKKKEENVTIFVEKKKTIINDEWMFVEQLKEFAAGEFGKIDLDLLKRIYLEVIMEQRKENLEAKNRSVIRKNTLEKKRTQLPTAIEEEADEREESNYRISELDSILNSENSQVGLLQTETLRYTEVNPEYTDTGRMSEIKMTKPASNFLEYLKEKEMKIFAKNYKIRTENLDKDEIIELKNQDIELNESIIQHYEDMVKNLNFKKEHFLEVSDYNDRELVIDSKADIHYSEISKESSELNFNDNYEFSKQPGKLRLAARRSSLVNNSIMKFNNFNTQKVQANNSAVKNDKKLDIFRQRAINNKDIQFANGVLEVKVNSKTKKRCRSVGKNKFKYYNDSTIDNQVYDEELEDKS